MRGHIAVAALVLGGCYQSSLPAIEAAPAIDAAVVAPDALAPTHAGLVFVAPQSNAPGTVVGARFGPGSLASLEREALAPGCRLRDLTSHCALVTCTSYFPTESAGTLHVTLRGTETFDASVVTEPRVAGQDSLYGGSGPAVLQAGDAVTVSADGAIVPAFALTATAPTAIDPDTFPWPAALSRSHDLVLSWPPGDADRVDVILSAVPYTNELVWCIWSGTPATTTVEAAALAVLPESGDVLIGVDAIRTQTMVVGDYVIELEVASQASILYPVMP